MQSHQELLHLHVSKGKCKRCIPHDIITFYKFHNGILQPLEIFVFSDWSNIWVVHKCKFATLCFILSFTFFLSDHLYFYDACLSRSYLRRCLYSLPVLQKKKMQFVQKFNFLGWMLGNKGDFKVASVQSSHSVVSDSLWPCGLQLTRLPCPSPTPRAGSLMSIKSVMPSNHLILCYPLLLPSNVPSIRVFSNKSVISIRWPNYWSFSFSISPSTEYSGLISFRMDWLDILAVQETLKSLLQHHSSKIINSSVLSFLYSPTLTSIHDYWKNHSFD